MGKEDAPMDGVDLPLALPQTVWDAIVQLVFEPVWELKGALIQIKSLSLVSQSLRRACKNAVLRLDAHRSLNAHVAALAKLSIAVEFLDLDDFYNREFVLRSATFIEHSARTLRHLSAAVTTTDTLTNFPFLQNLKLHGQESFPRLYPAVLQTNLQNLKHLELVNYEHMSVTDEVPKDVLENLETLTVRPRPNGALYWLLGHVCSLNLKLLKVDGSFNHLQATNFAPSPKFDLYPLLAIGERIVIEAGCVIMEYDMEEASSSYLEFSLTDDLESYIYARWTAAVLLRAPATLKRLEFRTLERDGLLFTGAPAPGWAPTAERYSLADLKDALEEMAPGGTYEGMHWEYAVENQSIFEVYCLRLWRD